MVNGTDPIEMSAGPGVYVADKSVGSSNVPSPEVVQLMLEALPPNAPDNMYVPPPQMLASNPALAVATWLLAMATVSTELGQVPLEIFQSSIDVPPIVNEVTPEVGEDGVVIAAVPEITDQVPVPTTGEFAASVTKVTLHSVWSGPAKAVEGMTSTEMITSS